MDVTLDLNQIKSIIPHRYPVLLVDRILRIEDKKIIGIKNITAESIFFEGHFPDNPIFPGVLLIEAMAQTAACYLLRKEENRKKLLYFSSIDNAKFRKPVFPGDQLLIEVEEAFYKKGKAGKAKGRILINDELACECNFNYVIAEKK